jgi:hypothetical protein
VAWHEEGRLNAAKHASVITAATIRVAGPVPTDLRGAAARRRAPPVPLWGTRWLTAINGLVVVFAPVQWNFKGLILTGNLLDSRPDDHRRTPRMTTFSEYTTVIASHDPTRGGLRKGPDQLDGLVADAIARGWQPHGGVSVAFEKNLIVFAQALVR